MYRIGPNFHLYSRRDNWRIVDSVTAGATQKTDEKTTKMVCNYSGPLAKWQATHVI